MADVQVSALDLTADLTDKDVVVQPRNNSAPQRVSVGTLAATALGAGIAFVNHDSTLTGEGTADDELSVVSQVGDDALDTADPSTERTDLAPSRQATAEALASLPRRFVSLGDTANVLGVPGQTITVDSAGNLLGFVHFFSSNILTPTTQNEPFGSVAGSLEMSGFGHNQWANDPFNNYTTDDVFCWVVRPRGK